ncbi:Peptidase family M49 [Aspergillus sp. HF37]|nr:Peptidase family M49 [Aspergillus sp. HF37]
MDEVRKFLDYCALFLSNVGNYYGSGDQKFTPDICETSLVRLASVSLAAANTLENIKGPMYQTLPNSLGAPSAFAQSAYYLGEGCLDSSEGMSAVSRAMRDQSIFPENTRLKRQSISDGNETWDTYDILQASVTEDTSPCQRASDQQVRLVHGDHRYELQKTCENLQKAQEYTSNHAQQEMLQRIQTSFYTGDLDAYRQAQRVWVQDKGPAVETVIGFVEPYRDPLGVRAEFEGIVGIADPQQTKTLERLAGMADGIIHRLPWSQGYAENNGKGPFEKELFDPPDFASVQSLAYCSSIVFPGINLPNYNDIRQETGYKNIIFSNRMATESQRARGMHMVDKSERTTFQSHRFHAYYLWVVLHEVLGHGTGKLLMQDAAGTFNFDPNSPPVDPLTGKPVCCWYHPGQTWTDVFGDLATTVDECRAELVGAYLMDDLDILRLFGYTDDSEVKSDDVTYNMYLQLGVDGLRGLENYNLSTDKWGQAHSRVSCTPSPSQRPTNRMEQAHFAILRHLLRDCPGLFTINCDTTSLNLTVKLDRSRIVPDGKAALGRILLRLHVYRCTADVTNCRDFYEDLCRVDEEALNWRRVIRAKKDPPLVFCQANTYVDEDGDVKLKEYDSTPIGIIQSWAERGI